MTYKDIVHAIKEMEDEKLTDQTASIMADLLYIRDHWHGHRAESMEETAGDHPCFSRETAEEWTACMKNEDGTTGPHWTMARIQQEIEQRGICCDPVKFWAVINSIYSDDCAVARKHGINTMDYYIDRAKAWIDDKDAVEDKAAAYYRYVVRH